MKPRKKTIIDREKETNKMLHEYIIEGLTVREIAKKNNCSHGYVGRLVTEGLSDEFHEQHKKARIEKMYNDLKNLAWRGILKIVNW